MWNDRVTSNDFGAAVLLIEGALIGASLTVAGTGASKVPWINVTAAILLAGHALLIAVIMHRKTKRDRDDWRGLAASWRRCAEDTRRDLASILDVETRVRAERLPAGFHLVRADLVATLPEDATLWVTCFDGDPEAGARELTARRPVRRREPLEPPELFVGQDAETTVTIAVMDSPQRGNCLGYHAPLTVLRDQVLNLTGPCDVRIVDG